MLQTSSVILTVIYVFASGDGFSVNKTAELISTYAKVAHWGTATTTKPLNEGRSNGQSLWTHRSDVNIRKEQNIKQKQPVTYYYSMQAPSSKVDQSKEEPIPAKGEVEERFNPRPYFDFVFDDPPRASQQKEVGQSGSKSKPPAVVYGTPVDSFPGFDKPPSSESDSKPPADLYNSPFSSYNPPDGKPDGAKGTGAASFDFPPNSYQASTNNQPPPPSTLYDSPTDNKPPSMSYGLPVETPNSETPPPNSYNAPPTDIYGAPPNTYDAVYKPPKESSKPENNLKPSNGYSFHPPLMAPPQDDSMPSKQPDNSYMGPPPPNGDDDSSYYAPPSPHGNGHGAHSHSFDHHHANGMDNGHDSDYGPPISQTVPPPGPVEQPYFDHPPTDNHHHHHHSHSPSMAEEDLAPPVPETSYGKIPQYLDHPPNDHDLYHYGHHDVYHEVHHATTTTTTEAPRAGHYSYYYLGRKLWYIPLYFSVYFIVYVTILILKSIARHKIQFSHNFDKGRNSRGLDINYVNQTVLDAIENATNKYM